MLKGATDQGQRIFQLKCIIYLKFKNGENPTTINSIFEEAGMSHFPPKIKQTFWMNCIGDPLINIRLTNTSEFEIFNLDQLILISTNPFYEKKFLEFIDKRLERVIELMRMSPIELRFLEKIQKESDSSNKLKAIVEFTKRHPRPLFSY